MGWEGGGGGGDLAPLHDGKIAVAYRLTAHDHHLPSFLRITTSGSFLALDSAMKLARFIRTRLSGQRQYDH